MGFSGGFPKSHHLEMVLDSERVSKLRQAIDHHSSPVKTFMELGCGSGLFLRHAAERFARVTGVEADAAMIDIAERTLAETRGAPTIIHGDALSVSLESRQDVILCEMLSTWMIIEPQVPVIRHARANYLAPGGAIIPSRVTNTVEVGRFEFGNELAWVPTPLLQFAGVRAPTIVTRSEVATSFDLLRDDLPDEIDSAVRLQALVDCTVNCVRLASIVELAPRIVIYCTETLMPLTICPLREPAEIRRGQDFALRFKYHHAADISHAVFWIEQ
jgi:predicted RNA methylase